jgi:uncharacterized membrane protein YeaQ/YmgE (transglycosylase-associated protein family)
MGCLGWIVLGGLAGWIGSIIAGTNSQMGFFANVITGIVGAFVGGLLMNVLGKKKVTGFNFYSLAVAAGGAALTLFIARKLSLL